MKKVLILTTLLTIIFSSCTPKTSWTLEIDNDLGKKYTGQAELHGWIIYKSFYVEENIPHFHVLNEDIKKLPQEIHHKSDYFLNTDSKEAISILETYSENNPATILVDELNIMAEGSPSLHLVEIID